MLTAEGRCALSSRYICPCSTWAWDIVMLKAIDFTASSLNYFTQEVELEVNTYYWWFSSWGLWYEGGEHRLIKCERSFFFYLRIIPNKLYPCLPKLGLKNVNTSKFTPALKFKYIMFSLLSSFCLKYASHFGENVWSSFSSFQLISSSHYKSK